jgi:DNA-binding MarR family transcriptional regulator
MISERPDISALHGCACYQVRRLSRQITQAYDRHLSACGLTTTQFALLTAVNTNGPVAVTGLAEALGMDRTTLTRLIKPLEREGLVMIAPSKDRRIRVVALTAGGRDRFERAIPHWKDAYRELRDRIGRERLEALRATLGEASALLSASPPQAVP